MLYQYWILQNVDPEYIPRGWCHTSSFLKARSCIKFDHSFSRCLEIGWLAHFQHAFSFGMLQWHNCACYSMCIWNFGVWHSINNIVGQFICHGQGHVFHQVHIGSHKLIHLHSHYLQLFFWNVPRLQAYAARQMANECHGWVIGRYFKITEIGGWCNLSSWCVQWFYGLFCYAFRDVRLL
jgi:hypothetical protein